MLDTISKRSRSNLKSNSVLKNDSGKGSDLDLVFDAAERKAKLNVLIHKNSSVAISKGAESIKSSSREGRKRFSLMELEPIQSLLVENPLLADNVQLLKKQIAFKDEMTEDRKQMRTRLEELRAQKYELLKQRNSEIMKQN